MHKHMYTYMHTHTYLSYFFLEFATAEQANSAVKAGNGYRLDKSHIFAVNHFADFEKWDWCKMHTVFLSVPSCEAQLVGIQSIMVEAWGSNEKYM